MQKVCAGDLSAYRQLLQRQLPAVSRYVMRMTGTSHDAEDITQEVFVRLWTRAKRFDPQVARVSTWLHNIAHNLCIDHFRRQSRYTSRDQADDLPGGPEPEMEVSNASSNEAIKDALLAIPERQRSAVVMCHYQGLSNKEAAAILDISVDALESLLARGRRNLKNLLNINEHGT